MKTKQEFGVKCENHFHLSEMEADHITPGTKAERQ
jgi:hypothetical protein